MEKLLKEGTAGQPHPAASVYTPVCIQEQLLKHLQEHTDTKCYMMYTISLSYSDCPTVIHAAKLDSVQGSHALHPSDTRFVFETTHRLTFMPLSQLIHRSPLVRKQATACRARWWIQPSCLSWVMMASIQGKPVRPSAHLASASGFWSHGIWT